MSETDRRSAREQPLPELEAAILGQLKGNGLYFRCQQLFQAGWTLRAIAEAMNPPRSRSTVASWIKRIEGTAVTTHLPDPVAPEYATPPVYIPKKPQSPGISATDLTIIQDLAPIARKYRSGMSPRHTAAVANQTLTDTCLRLNQAGVSITELAEAAGVTYRAMAKRLGRA